MIFLGDCAHPFAAPPPWAGIKMPWGATPVVVNLEGALLPNQSPTPPAGLFNRESLIPALQGQNVCVAFLANNHIADLEGGLARTAGLLDQAGIRTLGAGLTEGQARAPVVVETGGHRFALLGFGWSVIGCRSRPSQSIFINQMEPERMIDDVRKVRASEPSSHVLVVVHWNYELEPHPQPAHRELARELLRVGADAVIGHHPHVVGGVEWFEGKPVVYSLGNWWLPQGHFRGGRVRYPDSAGLQLAFEYRVDRRHRGHWFTYRASPDEVAFSSTEELTASPELARRTPFARLSADEYLPWFRRNRHKKRALPIFRDYTAVGANRVREELVWLRHQGLMLLEATRLRAMLRL